jgi:hypothetical protein
MFFFAVNRVSVFGSVVAVAFQSVFYSKIYQNNIYFFIFLIIFYISALK